MAAHGSLVEAACQLHHRGSHVARELRRLRACNVRQAVTAAQHKHGVPAYGVTKGDVGVAAVADHARGLGLEPVQLGHQPREVGAGLAHDGVGRTLGAVRDVLFGAAAGGQQKVDDAAGVESS